MILLRPATFEDEEFLYNLKNDKDVLKNSYIIREEISIPQYHEWFIHKIEESTFLIILLNNKPIGDIRIDDDGEISVRVIKRYRNKGYAKKALNIIINQNEYYEKFYAWIIDGNIASMKLFLSLGFRLVQYEKFGEIGRYLFHYEL